MSEKKHTPGPWRWEFNKDAKGVYLVGGKPKYDKTVMQFARWGMGRAVPLFNSAITGNEFNIMERLCDVPEWTEPFPGLEHHKSWRMDVTHPDARLMAAAPDLLFALQNLLAVKNGEGGTTYNSDDIARAAIAKATGAQQ